MQAYKAGIFEEPKIFTCLSCTNSYCSLDPQALQGVLQEVFCCEKEAVPAVTAHSSKKGYLRNAGNAPRKSVEYHILTIQDDIDTPHLRTNQFQ